MKTEQGTVTVKFSDDNEKSQSYTKKIYESADDVLSELGDEKSLKSLIANLNYGTDLKLRSVVRSGIVEQFSGPDKAIAKLAKDLVKLYASLGKTISEEKATEMAKSQFADAQSDESVESVSA